MASLSFCPAAKPLIKKASLSARSKCLHNIKTIGHCTTHTVRELCQRYKMKAIHNKYYFASIQYISIPIGTSRHSAQYIIAQNLLFPGWVTTSSQLQSVTIPHIDQKMKKIQIAAVAIKGRSSIPKTRQISTAIPIITSIGPVNASPRNNPWLNMKSKIPLIPMQDKWLFANISIFPDKIQIMACCPGTSKLFAGRTHSQMMKIKMLKKRKYFIIFVCPYNQ